MAKIASATFQCGYVEEPIPGPKGEDAVTYDIVVSPEAWTLKADGTVPFKTSSEYPRATFYKTVGDKRTVIESGLNNGSIGLSVKAVSQDGTVVGTTWSQDGTGYLRCVINPMRPDGTGHRSIRVELYKGTVLMAAKDCSIAQDGPMGVPGPDRKPLRVLKWDAIGMGTWLYNGLHDDDEWTDIVYIEETTPAVKTKLRYWRCVENVQKTDTTPLPGATDTPATNKYVGKLEECSASYSMLATDILLAAYAVVKNLGVEAIEMRDSAGNLKFYAKDGDVTCNTGIFKSIEVEDSTLKNITCQKGNFTDIHISGQSTFRGFVMREKFQITENNWTDVLKRRFTGTYENGEQYDAIELDFEKTGPWIEIKSPPAAYTIIRLALPYINPQHQNIDWNRDFVRRYYGTELMIYNTSNREIFIDTGWASCHLLNNDCVVLRLVSDPYKPTNSIYSYERMYWVAEKDTFKPYAPT